MRQQNLCDKLFERLEVQWLPKMITFIINVSASDLSEDLKQVLEQELMKVTTIKVEALLNAVFNQDQDEWMAQLHIDRANETQIMFYSQVAEQIGFMVSLENPNPEDIDSVAQQILKNEELKHELGKLVAELTIQVREEVGKPSIANNTEDYNETNSFEMEENQNVTR